MKTIHWVEMPSNPYFYAAQAPVYEMPSVKPAEQEKKTAQPEPNQ